MQHFSCCSRWPFHSNICIALLLPSLLRIFTNAVLSRYFQRAFLSVCITAVCTYSAAVCQNYCHTHCHCVPRFPNHLRPLFQVRLAALQFVRLVSVTPVSIPLD